MFKTLEVIGVILIMLGQGYIFYITFMRIREYKDILLPRNLFKIRKFDIPINDINNLDPHVILSQLNRYSNPDPIQAESLINESNKVEISLIISVPELSSPALHSILEATNTYLIRNRSAVADFNLIKDIVERTGITIEEEINSTISVPLYLGLLGTLLGIIFGLFNISDVSVTGDVNKTTDILNEAIPVLLGGVRLAMFASFTGLLLTVINSGIFYRKAKTLFEVRKNDFYSFIQAELLPMLNQSINSSLSSLQNNLHKFNEDFSVNIHKLSGLLNKNHDALIAQEKILTTLEKVDINEFAKANVKVLKELQKSTDSFSVFNQHIDLINDAVLGTSTIVTRINELLERTDNLDELSTKIISTFEENKLLMTFLQNHYAALDESKQMISDSVGTVSDILDKALQQLKEFTMSKINEVKELTIKEIDLMETKYPEKWKKLDNLVHLEKIGNSVNDIKLSNASQIERLTNELVEINEKLLDTVSQLEDIKNSAVTYNIKNWFQNRGIFRKKTVDEN
jgi:hypothetical protein